jgi:DNA polymerase-3 subunit delta
VAAKKKAEKIERFLTVAGSDEAQVREEAHSTFNELAEDPNDEFANETLSGAADNSEEAFQVCMRAAEALQTVPFFGSKVVWLKGVTFLADNVTGRAERTLEGLESLRGVLEAGLPDGVTFLLSATAIDKRRSFWKFVESRSDVRVFEKIDTSRDGWQEQVAAVVERRAADLGFRFESEALELFVMLAGEDTGQIATELEKLDLFLGERREVEVDDVRQMVPLSRAGVVFEIGNAIQVGEVGRALELIDRQMAQGDNAIGILRASVIPTVRNLFMAAVLLDGHSLSTGNYQSFVDAIDRLPAQDTAWLPRKKTGGVNAYPVFLAARQAGRFSITRLREALEACARADRDLVSTGRDPKLVLQKLVAGLAMPPKRAKAGAGGGR